MRRSRKIGLTQGGRVRDGRASEKWSRVFTRDMKLGHINQPLFHDSRRREEFAENFALEWAARLEELPKK
jgi:hypothetical protein